MALSTLAVYIGIVFHLLPMFVTGTINPTIQMAGSFVRTVAVVGGTHGNEYTGVFCVKALEQQLAKKNENYPFQISTLIGNPEAYKANRRFVDEDLNRQFSGAAMVAAKAALPATLSVEQRRAREIDDLLGPKFGRDGDANKPPTMDFIIDLHTTTANMHTSLIVGQGDPLTTQAAAYVMHKCREKNLNVCILMHTHASQEARPNLASIAPHSFSIEVGPVSVI